MRRERFRVTALIFLTIMPGFLCGTPNVRSFPSDLSTNNQNLFVVKFQQVYDYVHRYLNVTTFALENPHYTDSYVINAPERWNLAYFALLLTYAYSLTSDARYLIEAKYFVDNLNQHLYDQLHFSLEVNTAGFEGWLYADTALLWSMVRLHELGYGPYLGTVNDRINLIMNHASIDNTSYLAFNYVWHTASDITLNTYVVFSYLLSYLTKQGLGDYQNDVQRIITGIESQRRPNNLFPYNWGESSTDDIYSSILVEGEIFNKRLLQTLNVDASKVQLSIDAFQKSAYGAGDPYLALMALKEGFKIGQKLRTQWKEYLEDQRFDQRTTKAKNGFPAGHRTIMYDSLGLIYLFYYDVKTTDYSFEANGYIKWSEGSGWHYGFNNTASTNVTRTDVGFGFEVTFDGYWLLRCWRGIPWDFDSLVYNATCHYWRGFKEGAGTLAGQNLTLDIYAENRKIVARRNIVNANPVYSDTQIEVDPSVVGDIFIWFPNGSSFNVTAVSDSAYLAVPEYWAWTTEKGHMFVYKMQNDTSSQRNIKIITLISENKAVATAATYIEVYPFVFGGTNNTAIKQKQMSILQQISSGTYNWDETFSLKPEGSIKWQLKHYPEISLYSDKNMTASTFSLNQLSAYIMASVGQTSTTTVYTGDLGMPANVTGATSYSYDPTTKTLTIMKTHQSEMPARIAVSWSPFPNILSTNDSLFMEKFQSLYFYIHRYLNTTTFTSENPYYTDYLYLADPEVNIPERQNLAYFALILTYAYSYTGDVQYLVEAKYFVDNLNQHLYDNIHNSLEVNSGDFTGYLYADSVLLWAMIRLHEFGYGNYLDTVKQRITVILNHAAINTSQYLAWCFVWHEPQTQDLRLHAYVNFAYLLAYISKQGLGEYTTAVQKIVNGWESRRRPDNLFPDDWNDAFSNAPNSIPIITAEIFLRQLLPQLSVNSTKVQQSLNAIEASPHSSGFTGEPLGNGDPSLAYVAMKTGFAVGQKMRVQWKQYIEDDTFEERCLQSKNFFPSGHRAIMYGSFDLVFWYYYDAQTTDFQFAEGGYTKWFDGSTWHYGFNNTVGINITRVDVNYGFTCRAFTYPILTFWYGANWEFDTLAYDPIGKYWEGFKQGTGTLSGQNLTLCIYPEMRKVIASRNVINNNPFYSDRQISADVSVTGQIYLYFPNGSYYNVTALSGTTEVKVPEYFAWVHLQGGEMYVYKVQNYTDTADRWIRIASTGTVRTLFTTLTYAEVYPFKFWGSTYSAGLKDKQMSILQQIESGTYAWDETFPLTPEGSMKWQLKHYPEVSIYTNRNITCSGLDADLLTMNVNAPTDQLSTTVVYTGSKGKPINVTGATSYNYNSTNRLLTIILMHTTEAPAEILVSWKPDIAILDVAPFKTVVGQGFSLGINVTITNQGNEEQEFNVQVYANSTSISSQEIVLEGGGSTTVAFIWSTTGFAKGKYTICAYVPPLQFETDTTDNTQADGNVIVAIVGDINGPTQSLPDGTVNIIDLATIGVAYGSHQGLSQWNPNADINNDSIVDIVDLAICARNYGKIDQ